MGPIMVAAWRFVAGLTRPSKRAGARRLRARGETAASFAIRDLDEVDIPALARLHVAAWNATYAPLLVTGPGHELRERQWREAYAARANDPSWFCLVVVRRDGELVGFAQGGRSDHPRFAGELRKIYLLPDYQRVGLGRRLLGRVARRFRRHGIDSMWLGGDARNPSVRAWLATGAEKVDSDPGSGNYGWRHLGGLAELPD